MAVESPVGVLPSQGEKATPELRVSRGRLLFPSSLLPRLLPALITAGLMFLCYFPLAWGWLAWVALVPLLFLIRAEGRARNIYLAAWMGGLAFYWPVLQWMRVADYRMVYTWAMLATYCSLYFPLAIWLMRWLDRNSFLPLVFTVPAVWTGLEFIRSFLLTGFAWYYLGHTQHAILPMIQIADVAGVYGVTFLVAAANAWLFELLYARGRCRAFFHLGEVEPGRWLAVKGFTVLVLIGAALFYGFWRLDQEYFTPGPRLALLQGNLDQRIRNNAAKDRDAQIDLVEHYRALCTVAIQQVPRPDLVVWPETSFAWEWYDISTHLPIHKLPAQWRDVTLWTKRQFSQLSKAFPANHLLGMNTHYLDEEGQRRYYNSALLQTAGGQFPQRYDKIHRVPFGEFVPFKDWLPFMNAFAPYENDYSIRQGEHLTRFQMGEHRFGVLICYEDTDPFLARQYGVDGADGPAVDFLVNISNDGWFDGTSEHEEHLAICRFRAIECRRAVARSVNMGISAVIDSNGRILEPRLYLQTGDYKNWEIVERNDQVPELPGAHWAEFKKVAGVVAATVPIDRRVSLYARWGDWLPLSCWAVIGCGFIGSIGRWRRKKDDKVTR